MSGGSWDYVCFTIEQVADKLKNEKSALRRALGIHMEKIAHAMHEIEWCDSGELSRRVAVGLNDGLGHCFRSERD